MCCSRVIDPCFARSRFLVRLSRHHRLERTSIVSTGSFIVEFILPVSHLRGRRGLHYLCWRSAAFFGTVGEFLKRPMSLIARQRLKIHCRARPKVFISDRNEVPTGLWWFNWYSSRLRCCSSWCLGHKVEPLRRTCASALFCASHHDPPQWKAHLQISWEILEFKVCDRDDTNPSVLRQSPSELSQSTQE